MVQENGSKSALRAKRNPLAGGGLIQKRRSLAAPPLSFALMLGTVVALFLVREEHEVPVQHIEGQHYEHHNVRPALGEQEVIIKGMEFHSLLLVPSGHP